MDREGRAAERFRGLVAQLLREKGGNQSEVARVLGISQTYVNKIKGSVRGGGGTEAITSAIEHLGLEPEYFFGDYEGEADYHEFLRDVPAEERYPALQEFLAIFRESRGITDDELAYLRRASFRDADVPSYLVIFENYRRRQIRQGPSDESDPLEHGRRRALDRGGRPIKGDDEK